jgi:polyphosphate kinase
VQNGNDLLFNRELSELEFYDRVVQQAADPAMPLLERLRALCTVRSNLDQFYEIRVAGLRERCLIQSATVGPDGMAPQELYASLNSRVRDLVDRQYRLFNDVLVPALAEQQICFLRRPTWNPTQSAWTRDSSSPN